MDKKVQRQTGRKVRPQYGIGNFLSFPYRRRVRRWQAGCTLVSAVLAYEAMCERFLFVFQLRCDILHVRPVRA